MMISKANPIHRLRGIQREINMLVLQLAPFYAAAELIFSEEEKIQGYDMSTLESNSKFRPIWEKRNELEREAESIIVRLALSYERAPTEKSPFE